MKRSQRWNNLQICPHRDSNSGGSDLRSNTLPTRPRRRLEKKSRKVKKGGEMNYNSTGGNMNWYMTARTRDLRRQHAISISFCSGLIMDQDDEHRTPKYNYNCLFHGSIADAVVIHISFITGTTTSNTNPRRMI